jgi:hypothetical protein
MKENGNKFLNMKKIILVALIIILGVWLCYNYFNSSKISVKQNGISEIISNIDEECKKIDSDTNLTVIEKSLTGLSTEGGVLLSYYDKSRSLKKAAINFYGEMGQKITEYHYKNREPIFCSQRQLYYDQPIYIEGSHVDKIEENRYYFHNQSLIKWTDTNKTNTDTGSEEATKIGKELIEEGNAILNGLYGQ